MKWFAANPRQEITGFIVCVGGLLLKVAGGDHLAVLAALIVGFGLGVCVTA